MISADSTNSEGHPFLTVIISEGQSRSPDKRELESAVMERAQQIPGVEVLRVPHLYDLAPKSPTLQAIQQRQHNMIVISWLYDRAIHWVLDRNGIRGSPGEVWLREETDSDVEDEESNNEQTVATIYPRPNRQIFCIDFRASTQPQEFANEILRIAELSRGERSTALTIEMLQRAVNPTNDTYLGSPHLPLSNLEETPGRRWYPVIDFSRCTNCMECIDFCLFGVYGVDGNQTIVVEQADNCRKGCPACSRVCPQNAIMFPQHKTPAIAGAQVDMGSMKIDLSKLFGAPESNEDAAAVAARERDEQLILAGRAAVVSSVTERQNKGGRALSQAPNDQLDKLLDQLDSLDL